MLVRGSLGLHRVGSGWWGGRKHSPCLEEIVGGESLVHQVDGAFGGAEASAPRIAKNHLVCPGYSGTCHEYGVDHHAEVQVA